MGDTDTPNAAFPYPNRSHEATHCDRLFVRARLHGIAAAPPTKCRVLELGCAGGANLVGMALALPESEFVGVDLSPDAIATARALVVATGVTNVRFVQQSATEVTRADGEFDYVVAHGLYSWVSADVQAKVFEILGEMLAPNGVGYLSYNTLPGFHTRAKAAGLMRWHTRDITDPKKKVEQALASLKWLCDAIGESTTYGKEMAAELALLRATNEGYIFHEHLVEHVGPSYFSDVCAAARARGLKFLAESDATTTMPEALPPGARELIAKIDDVEKAEQYVDFALDRRFRASLFCRAERDVSRAIDLGVLASSWVSATCAIEGDAMDLSETPVTFVSSTGARAQLAQPLLKLALGILAARLPEPMTLDALVDATRAKLALSPRAGAIGDTAARLPSELAGALARLSMFGFVKIRGFAPAVTSQPSARPVARALAREQAKVDHVTSNVWHETVQLSATERDVVALLDGTRDRDAVVHATRSSKRDVDAALARLARAGVLVA